MLGSGATAVVYAATTPDGWHVAVKQLHPWFDTQAKDSLRHELQMLWFCAHESFVVPGYYIIDDGQMGLVMDRLQADLLHCIENRVITIQDFLCAAGQLAQALYWLECCAVVHGDVKPANIFAAKVTSSWAR